jgi:hypothetical protein
MITAVAIVMGLLALTALAFWILAIRLSYRIERLRKPDLPKPRMVYTNIFATAFASPATASAEEKKLQPQLRARLITALACLLVMAGLSFALPLLPGEPGAIQQAATTPPNHPTGTTLFYIRSNQSGSLPEQIIMHVAAPNEVHVAKMVSPCTDAAYVTAVFNPATSEATRLVGGRLRKDGTQLPQAWLDFDYAARRLDIRLGDPASEPVETHTAPVAPTRVYDFDLAEFALFGPRAPKDFAFGFVMTWPDGTSPVLRIPGEVKAQFLYSSDKGAKNHYRLGGPAFTDPVLGDRGGEMITDAQYGHVIEARFGRPNHTGYDNFLLKLTGVTTGAEGETAWKNALAAHWQNCPPEAADPT